MPKFMVTTRFAPAGVGLIEDHGIDQGHEVTTKLLEAVGVKQGEVYYYFDGGLCAVSICETDDPTVVGALLLGNAGLTGPMDPSGTRLMRVVTRAELNELAAKYREWLEAGILPPDPTKPSVETPAGDGAEAEAVVTS